MPRSRYSMKLRSPVWKTASEARLTLKRCWTSLMADPSAGMPYPIAGVSIDARGSRGMGIEERGVLRGKVAIVTGAATGIGRASALLFAQAGARVCLADLREPELARTVAEVRA